MAAWITGCDEDIRATPGCTPNHTQECACPGQQLGIQTCQVDNTWSDCVCQSSDAGDVTGADATGGDDADDGGTIDLELSSDFEPDPREIELEVGGPVDVSEEEHSDEESGEDCAGFVPVEPHVYITVLEPAPDGIRLRALSEIDTTLIVHFEGADTYRCNDDFNEEGTPQLELLELETGDYEVWVGSLEGEGEATLVITEL
jgi:hypothetical protein